MPTPLVFIGQQSEVGFKHAGWCLWSTGLLECPNDTSSSERKRVKIRGGSFERKSSSSQGVTVTTMLDMEEDDGRITFLIDGWKVPKTIVGVHLRCPKIVFAVIIFSKSRREPPSITLRE